MDGFDFVHMDGLVEKKGRKVQLNVKSPAAHLWAQTSHFNFHSLCHYNDIEFSDEILCK